MYLLRARNGRDTFKRIFLSTALASSLLLAVTAVEPAAFSWATKAQAASKVSVSVTFYDALAPYGNWVSYHDSYVWIPENVDARWQPYTQGHWGYTRRHGWIWVSDEKFGWATYHYGRWGQAPDIGWYWVPDGRWAPAWVAWRYDDTHIAWAPLPPGGDAGKIGDIPEDSWQAVPVAGFLSPDDLSGRMYRDRDGASHGAPQTVRIANDIVVNDAIKVDGIEKKTKKKVTILEEMIVDKPDAAGKADSNSVAIFNPVVKEEPDAKPKKTSKLEEVVKERAAKGIPAEEQPSGQAATTTDEPVNIAQKGQPECDPAVADCPPAPALSKQELQSAKQVTAKTNLPDAGAQSWKANCSPQVGGWNNGADTYLSSAGKRVSCAMFPLKKMASAALPREITAEAERRRQTGKFEDLLEGKKLTVDGSNLDDDDTNSDGKEKGGNSQGSNSGKGNNGASEEKTSNSQEN